MMRDISFTSTDGLALHAWTRWPAGPAPAKGVIAHVHGMGEHSRRYDHLTAYWADRGYASAGFDLRGHGRSEGKRGHTPDYERLMDDIARFLARVTEATNSAAAEAGDAAAAGSLPITLYGHSLGGNLVLNYAIRRKPSAPIAHLVATSPYLRLAFAPPAWKIHLAHLARHIAPALTQPTRLNTAALSRDPAVRERYAQDPLVHGQISAAFFLEAHAAGESIIARASELTTPTLILHGDADAITSHIASETFVASSAGKATLRVWDGGFHELHNEAFWQEVADFILLWIARHS